IFRTPRRVHDRELIGFKPLHVGTVETVKYHMVVADRPGTFENNKAMRPTPGRGHWGVPRQVAVYVLNGIFHLSVHDIEGVGNLRFVGTGRRARLLPSWCNGCHQTFGG